MRALVLMTITVGLGYLPWLILGPDLLTIALKTGASWIGLAVLFFAAWAWNESYHKNARK